MLKFLHFLYKISDAIRKKGYQHCHQKGVLDWQGRPLVHMGIFKSMTE